MNKDIEVVTPIQTKLVYTNHVLWIEVGPRRIASILVSKRKPNPTVMSPTWTWSPKRTKWTAAVWVGSLHPTAGSSDWRSASISDVLKFLRDMNIDPTEFLDTCRQCGWEEKFLEIKED